MYQRVSTYLTSQNRAKSTALIDWFYQLSTKNSREI